jgi:hypothetical protein
VSTELPRRHIKLGALPRHHRPPSRALRRIWSVLGFVLARGELVVLRSPSLCFPFSESCSESSFCILRRWRHRGTRHRSSIPVGAPPSADPIQSELFVLNPTAEISRYRFGC